MHILVGRLQLAVTDVAGSERVQPPRTTAVLIAGARLRPEAALSADCARRSGAPAGHTLSRRRCALRPSKRTLSRRDTPLPSRSFTRSLLHSSRTESGDTHKTLFHGNCCFATEADAVEVRQHSERLTSSV